MRNRKEENRTATRGTLIGSIHMKLTLILVLLIISVMIVVGTLLINRVTSFYLDEFRTQMEDIFDENLLVELESLASGEDAPARLRDMVGAYAGPLGINADRAFYILDGSTGIVLAGSGETAGNVELTPNVITALSGDVGASLSMTNEVMDLAIPLRGGETGYILYICDSKADLNELTWVLFTITVQVVLFGLVFAVLLSFLLSKTLSTPIESITKGAKRLASGQFDRQLTVHSADEIGVLTQTFNQMATSLQESMDAVENERDKLNTLFRHMTDGVAAFDADGKILLMNPAAEAMLGVGFNESLSFADLFGEMKPEPVYDDQGKTLGVEYNKGERNLQVFIAPLGSSSKVGGTMEVIHDITEQYKLEKARREFVANVSHELRTPLTSIKSYTETLMDAPDLPPELSQKFLGVICNESDRMARIVKDLLTLSRLDYGRLDMKYSRFDTGKLVQGIYDAMLFEAKNHQHTLVLKADPNLPEIDADRERIEQVVVNIVSNAVKYTPNGGTITLEGFRDGSNVVFRVTDTGTGIPKEDLPRIFERFYRVDKARSREKGGTGLGLAIASEIVRLHNGTISLDSTVDVGTTVTITLPIERIA